jgi:hypothetical protein
MAFISSWRGAGRRWQKNIETRVALSGSVAQHGEISKKMAASISKLVAQKRCHRGGAK